MTERQISATSGTPLRQSLEAHDRTAYFYPPVPPLQYPPPARTSPGKRHSEGQNAGNARVQSSISSASESSAFSYRKIQTSTPDSYWPSPTLERTLVNNDQQYPTRWEYSGSTGAGHGHPKSEMTETASPALASIRERRQIQAEEDDEEEEDHAIWVLVRMLTP